MKRAKIFVIFLMFGLSSTFTAQSFIGKLNQNPTQEFNRFTESDTLKILAVLSDFQEDIDDATFGDGTFESIYSQDYGTTILDPLPHDKMYFENHLKFVQNYFTKVSSGKLNISYTVLDEILTVSKTMRNYTPNLDNLNDLTPVGEYVQEVWALADVKYPNVNFEDYDLFLVFHAGVGKDISLPGSLGNERDLPSVYMNEKSLKNIFGSDFTGFSVGNNGFQITNSAVMPETESREVEGFDGTTLIELTTNGLLAATVGSYLGLPDLYNTETGRSAIGRFGLMDGQSMFSYQGIFPPEPSAWEKMFLGWVTPTEVSLENQNVNLVNKYVAGLSDTTLIKIPINATEYYLVENRKRDALKDGSNVTYISDGRTLTKSFDKDYYSYIYYSVDTLEGVIVDVDEFDWALPGEDRNWNVDSFKDIGLIIWHIDERIIADNYETNTINNDRYKRGIAIVEADGIRDIGEEFQTVFGETVIGEGTKEDTWYSSNPADYYENNFSADTKPKAESNSHVSSLITLSNISDISNSAYFDLAFGSEYVDLIGNFQLSPTNNLLSLSSIDNGQEAVHFATLFNTVIKFNSKGIINETNILGSNHYKPLIVGLEGTELVVIPHNETMSIIFFDGNSSEIKTVTDSNLSTFTTSPILFLQTDTVIEFLIGNSSGNILKYSLDIDSRVITLIESNQIFATPVIQIATSGNDYASISLEKFWSSKFSGDAIELDSQPVNLASSRNLDGEDKFIAHLKSLNFAVIVGEEVEYHTYSTPNGFVDYPIVVEIEHPYPIGLLPKNTNISALDYKMILADTKNDGENYLILNGVEYLNSFSQTGSTASNFPFQDEYASTFVGSPVAVDLNNDDAADIITCTEDGKILAVDGITGKMIDGFPISSGGKVSTVPIIFTENGRTALGVVTENNQFMSWNISQYDGKKFWTEENGNASNTSSVDAASSTEKIAEFFPESKAYNWPNPVYEGITNIRYFVAEDSKATVNIFDLAGDLVAKLSGNGIGGFDNEIVWNVENIQSGVYFAHLEVTSNSGQTNSKIIKIAVIK